MKSKAPFIIIGLVLLASAIVGVALFWQGPSKTPTTSSNAKNSGNQPKSNNTAANLPPGAEPPWSKGSPSALVTIEEFSDFECPSCKAFEPTLRDIRNIYADRVRIIFRNYPLPQHTKAYDAARAAEAAGLQGKFWEMHDLIYNNQETWSKMPDHREVFKNYAKSLNLDVDKFQNDWVGQITETRIAADKRRGDAVIITGTPTVLINGRKILPDDMTLDRMRQIIDSELQKATNQTSQNTNTGAAVTNSGSNPTNVANTGSSSNDKK
jgi:protein-disulfide isomerase